MWQTYKDYKAPKVFKRSVWTMLTVFFLVMLLISVVGGSIANDYEASINTMLGINPYEKIETSTANEDTEYFKSDYYKDDGKYDDLAMRANSEKIANKVAVEGSVLLWNNDNSALPLARGNKVSIFGKTAQRYSWCGEGSGKINGVVPAEDNLRNALIKRGLQVNSQLWMKYSSVSSPLSLNKPWENRLYTFGVNETPWADIKDAVDTSIDGFNDAAIMLISRTAGEYKDINDSKTAGDYFTGANGAAPVKLYDDELIEEDTFLDLTAQEDEVLGKLKELRESGKVKKLVLLINSSNPMQFKNLRDGYAIDACVWVGQGGTMSFAQIGDILTGSQENIISGHLTDTYATSVRSAPSYENFGDFTFGEIDPSIPISHIRNGGDNQTFNQKYVAYQEGIYVGYRYYETRYEDTVIGGRNADSAKGVYTGGDKWVYSEQVAFPFGHGLSYAEFAYSDYRVEERDGKFVVSLTVENVSKNKMPGKEVLQVYLQKPYTDYDKEHGIEKAAVELVGFAKTDKLEAGKKQTLTVEVDASALKTYDSYGEKSYILERGKYYLAAGVNAHDAVNNILAKKGYTEADGMDAAGNADFVYEHTVDADDFTTYKTSEHTGKLVTNRFDDADINLYVGTAEQKITYLSRSDWDATYPTGVELDCVNEIMVKDMSYGEDVPVVEGDKLPKYGINNGFTLIMFKDLEYDDPMWEKLLDQMTVKEQQYLCSYGFRAMAGAESVVAPGAAAEDGPAGIRQPNPTTKTAMNLPCPVLMAATFDEPLIEKLGEAFALEALHMGYQVAYAPGSNIHRSPYSGRNWEYYSEDGFISGKILGSEIKGMQKRGIIVITKHFALNDQETNRYGVCTFANEQSVREIYLKPFEIAITEYGMNGLMSSFNRIGTTWAGAHRGLLTDILRTEWGFIGVVESDAAIDIVHMTSTYAKAEGIYAGNDLWMDRGSEDFLSDFVKNPTVMLALRESCHRILYNQLHSAAMNGVSSGTKIIKVQTSWQKALVAATAALSVIVALLALMAIASFVLNSAAVARAFNRERKRVVETGHYETIFIPGNYEVVNGAPVYNGKFKFFARNKAATALIALAVVAAIVLPSTLVPIYGGATAPVVAHACESVCDECGKCTSDCENVACRDKCEGHDYEHICTDKCEICGLCINDACAEPECAKKCGDGTGRTLYGYEAENSVLKGGLNIKTENGVTYVGNLNNNVGASLTFFIESEADTTATLSVRVSRRSKTVKFTDIMLVSVNGEEMQSTAIVEETGTGDDAKWAMYADVKLGCVKLKAGNNKIEFANIGSGNVSGFNFDRITLSSAEVLTDGDIIHECNKKCATCGKCIDLECGEAACADKCDTAGLDKYKFEAEDSKVVKKGGSKGELKIEGGGKVVGNLSENNGASLTFTVEVAEAGTAKLIVAVTKRSTEKLFTNGFTTKVGDTVVQSPATVPATGTGANEWTKSVEVNLGCIELKAGTNVITFTVPSASPEICFNFDYIIVASSATVTLK